MPRLRLRDVRRPQVNRLRRELGKPRGLFRGKTQPPGSQPMRLRTLNRDPRGKIRCQPQPGDGGVIYELFAPEAPDAPTMEVRFMGGEAAIMPPAH